MKIFLVRVIEDHYRSLKAWSILLHLLAVPAIVPFLMGFRFDLPQLDTITTALSIYSALLFSILIPAGEQARRLKKEKKEIEDKPDAGETVNKIRLDRLDTHIRAAKDILANVAFSIFVSLLDLLLFVTVLCMTKEAKSQQVVLAAGVTLTYPLHITEPRSLMYLSAAAGYGFVFVGLLLLVVIRSVYGSLAEEAK